MLSIYGGTSDYDNHSVTVVGYDDGDLVDLIWLHDTWDTYEHWIVYDNWDDATLTKVEEED